MRSSRPDFLDFAATLPVHGLTFALDWKKNKIRQ
jgi:hypothetical protein